MRKIGTLLSVTLLVLGSGVGAGGQIPFDHKVIVEMPNVLGLDLPNAKAKIADAGLNLGEVKEVGPHKAPRGIVVGQGPAPGTRIPQGYEVRVYVSKGPQ